MKDNKYSNSRSFNNSWRGNICVSTDSSKGPEEESMFWAVCSAVVRGQEDGQLLLVCIVLYYSSGWSWKCPPEKAEDSL